LFIDSANLADIEAALRTGAISGVTTNPTILAKEGVGDRLAHLQKIRLLIGHYYQSASLSVELTESEPAAMIEEALNVKRALDYPNLTIKVPIRWEWLPVLRELHYHQIKTNVTACMSYAQAIVAADAGATYVSLFWCRIRESGDASGGASIQRATWPDAVVRDVRTTFDENGSSCQIIVGSIRAARDVTDAVRSGAHVVTVPPQFLPLLCQHPKTDEAVSQFLRDAAVPALK
jgi:transaldolase